MAEHLTVDQVVVGSTPIAHPTMIEAVPVSVTVSFSFIIKATLIQ